MVTLFSRRINPGIEETALERGVKGFMEKIQHDAFKNDQALKNDISVTAEYLWTSAKSHKIVQGKELCSVLNAVIRDDVENEIKAAILFFRSINTRCVRRNSTGASMSEQSYPPNGETWRGGGFRQQYRSFFQSIKGHKYRVPGFLATTSKRSIAVGFLYKVDSKQPRALWRIMFDRRGEKHVEYRVRHMTFVSKTLIPEEGEYLFAPYSVFTLVSVRWSLEMDKPHQFTIRAAIDNKNEDENLPLAPWY